MIPSFPSHCPENTEQSQASSGARAVSRLLHKTLGCQGMALRPGQDRAGAGRRSPSYYSLMRTFEDLSNPEWNNNLGLGFVFLGGVSYKMPNSVQIGWGRGEWFT